VEVRSAEVVAEPNGRSYTGTNMTVPPHRFSGGSTFVPMVETAELREGNNFAGRWWQYRTGLRTVLVKREMSSRLVIISKIRR
jgi:hypothetical protein